LPVVQQRISSFLQLQKLVLELLPVPLPEPLLADQASQTAHDKRAATEAKQKDFVALIIVVGQVEVGLLHIVDNAGASGPADPFVDEIV